MDLGIYFFRWPPHNNVFRRRKKGIKTGFFSSRRSADFIEQFVFISVCLIVNYVSISISHNGINNDVKKNIVEFKYAYRASLSNRLVMSKN